jgi:hypothetical protein
LRFPTPFWANVWYSLTLAALTLAVPAAILSPRRAASILGRLRGLRLGLFRPGSGPVV